MNGEAPKAVLFDFGGVLTQPISDAFLASASNAGVAPELLRSVLVPMFMSSEDTDLASHRLERGEITLEEFLAGLGEHAAPVARLLDPASPHFVIAAFRPHREMLGFVEELRRAGVMTAVVSNAVREWQSGWDAALPPPAPFDALVYSWQVGARKPSPAIFEIALTRLGIDAEEALFLDDSPSMTAAAEAMGMRAIHVVEHGRAITEARRLCFPEAT